MSWLPRNTPWIYLPRRCKRGFSEGNVSKVVLTRMYIFGFYEGVGGGGGGCH